MAASDELPQYDSPDQEDSSSVPDHGADEMDEMLAEFVQEAEAAYDAEMDGPSTVEQDEASDDSGSIGESDVDEEDDGPLDPERAAKALEELQWSLGSVSGGSAKASEETSAPKYRLVRTVDIQIDPPVTQPLTLGLGENDSLYVLDRPSVERFRIIRVPFAGGRGEAIVELQDGDADNGLRDPVGIAVDDQGRMHIPDAEDNCIKVFSPDGRWLQTFETAGELGAAFDHPRDVDVAEDQHLYIADTYNNRLVKLTSDGEAVWEFEQFTHPTTGETDDELYEPNSVCVSNDQVAVADTNQNRIVIVGTDGTVRSVLESDGSFEFPSEVRITDDGTVYVADHSNLHVQRFAPDGTRSGFIDLRAKESEMTGGGDIDIDPDGNVVMIDPVREAVVVLGFIKPDS